MKIDSHNLIFYVKLPVEKNWTEVKIPLDNLKKQNLTCDESISMDIMEYVYATREIFYENEEELLFNVGNYWDNIVIPTHKKIYPEQYK
jgi:23S rRNA C2498 (ribose-2'-O)-methylase RlmM